MNMILSNEKVQEALGKVFDAVFALVDPLIESLIPVFEMLAEIMVELKPLFELMMPTIKLVAEVIKAVLHPIKELAKILVKIGDELNNLAKKFDIGSIGGGRGGLLGGSIIPGILQVFGLDIFLSFITDSSGASSNSPITVDDFFGFFDVSFFLSSLTCLALFASSLISIFSPFSPIFQRTSSTCIILPV